MFVLGARLTVPLGMIILRKGYGLGAMAMAGGSFRAPQFTVAWPTGEIGGMGLEGAVRLQEQETTGLSLAGYLSPPAEPPLGELRRLGGFEDLLAVVRDREIEEVVIALPASAPLMIGLLTIAAMISNVSFHLA